MIGRAAVTAWVVLLVGCGKAPPTPQLPPLELRDVEIELRGLVARTPPPPSENQLGELRALLEAAFLPGAADARLAARAQANLLEHEDVRWILEEGLRHEAAEVRNHAAFQLGQLGAEKAGASVVPLLLRLKYERDPTCTIWVADALARLQNHAGLAALASVLADGPRGPAPDTRRQAGEIAITILERSGAAPGERPSYAELERSLAQLTRSWQRSGRAATEPVLPDILTQGRIAEQVLALREFQLRPVDDARFVLARLGELAFPALQLTTRARNNYLRNHGLEVLRDLGPCAAALTVEILPLLGDDISAPYAVQALGALGDRRAVPHLVALLGDPNLDLRTAACGALGPIGATAAIPPLRRVLRGAKATLDERVYAAFSLALLEGGGEGLAYLQQRLVAQDYHAPTLRELVDRARGPAR